VNILTAEDGMWKYCEICSNALAVLAILKIYLRQKYCEVDILQFGSNFPP
jgi:hypothetical protein